MASSNQDNQGNPGKQKQGSGKSERGFASMDPQRQREIASEGGRAAHQSGKAHQFTSREASEAGRKGGQASGGGNRSANRGSRQGDNQGTGQGQGDDQRGNQASSSQDDPQGGDRGNRNQAALPHDLTAGKMSPRL